jgi:hypothetical protein
MMKFAVDVPEENTEAIIHLDVALGERKVEREDSVPNPRDQAFVILNDRFGGKVVKYNCNVLVLHILVRARRQRTIFKLKRSERGGGHPTGGTYLLCLGYPSGETEVMTCSEAISTELLWLVPAAENNLWKVEAGNGVASTDADGGAKAEAAMGGRWDWCPCLFRSRQPLAVILAAEPELDLVIQVGSENLSPSNQGAGQQDVE